MIRILIVDDQNLVREGIKILLEQAKEIQIVGEAKDGKEALKSIEMLQPDIVLLDIEMPDVSGLVVANKIKTRFPEVKIIMLSTHEDSSYMQKATNCGAKGYLLKSVSSQELEWSIRLVSQGYSAIKSELLEQRLSQDTKNDSNNSRQLVSLEKKDILLKQNKNNGNNNGRSNGNSHLDAADKAILNSFSTVGTLVSNNNDPNSNKLETLLTQNQVGFQKQTVQKKRKKKNNQLLHGVSLLRFKRTVASFEFKLLVFIILFSLGFLVFIALAS